MARVKATRYAACIAVYGALEQLDVASNAKIRAVLGATEPLVRNALYTLREWGVVKPAATPKLGHATIWALTDDPLPSVEDATQRGVWGGERGTYDHRALDRACRELSATHEVL